MSQKHPERIQDRAAKLRRKKAAAIKKAKKAARTKQK
jgi:hypothetical protein